MNDQINIVIADSMPIFLAGERQALETDKNFNIIGEATDGETALGLIINAKPDIAILAIDLPSKDGFEVARAVFARCLPVKLIFLTVHKSRSHFNAALNLGVKGYLLKDTPMSYLIDAVNTVSGGNCYISPVLSDFLIKRRRQNALLAENVPALAKLTTCEKRILVFISRYMTSREIADELFISVRTVHAHREHIAEKLGLNGRYCLLKFATDHHDELV